MQHKNRKERKTSTIYQILNYWHILHVHWSPAQFFVLFVKRVSVGSCFMLPSRVFQRKIPFNDTDSTPYDVVFVFGSSQMFFFIRGVVMQIFSLVLIQSMDS